MKRPAITKSNYKKRKEIIRKREREKKKKEGEEKKNGNYTYGVIEKRICALSLSVVAEACKPCHDNKKKKRGKIKKRLSEGEYSTHLALVVHAVVRKQK